MSNTQIAQIEKIISDVCLDFFGSMQDILYTSAFGTKTFHICGVGRLFVENGKVSYICYNQNHSVLFELISNKLNF